MRKSAALEHQINGVVIRILEIDMYLVMNIGCIECGVSSQVVGVFETEEQAKEIAKKFDEKYSWREGGQNSFEVFPVPEAGVINSEYEL